ncbi:MAG: hypothetical protein CL610_08005 [Anaerolineaceae bacterium]|nr:hypothetical protein [Anaerolineaceae bacterium]
MELRQLGRTGLQISSLSLGTVGLGLNYGIAAGSTTGAPPPQRSESVALIHRALDSGINFLDTARAYGDSEAVVGEALRGRREQAIVTTKVNCFDAQAKPLRGAALRERIHTSIRESLKLLQTDYVDLLMLHSAPVELLDGGEALDMLATVKAEGLTRSIGASTYGSDAPRLAIEQGAEALQVAYNVLDQRMADEIFPLAQARGVGMIVRSVYLKGVLTDRAEDLPDHLDALRQLSRQYRQLTGQFGIDPAQAALRFVLSNPDVSTALVGVIRQHELDVALDAAAVGVLPDDLLQPLTAMRIEEEKLLNPGYWGIP